MTLITRQSCGATWEATHQYVQIRDWDVRERKYLKKTFYYHHFMAISPILKLLAFKYFFLLTVHLILQYLLCVVEDVACRHFHRELLPNKSYFRSFKHLSSLYS